MTAAMTSTLQSSLLPSVPENLPLVRVAFDYEYDYKTRKIAVKQGEKLSLIQKTNQHWWKCMRPGVNKAFFVPAQYVIEDPGGSDIVGRGNKKSDMQKSSSSVDSSTSEKRRKSIFSTFDRLKESKESKPAVPSKSKSKSSISSRNEISRASHREKSHGNHHHERKSSSSSLRLKNWSTSLEELTSELHLKSKIVFPDLTSESVVDLTSLSANNSFKPKISTKQAAPNENPPCGRHGSCSSSGSGDGKFHTINKCLTFKNPAFEKGSPTNEQSQMDSTSHRKANPGMKSKDSSDGSLDCDTSKDSANDPMPKGPPLRVLSDNWAEYFSPEKGRYFYYNAEEKKTSWKPPRSSSNRRSDECLAPGRSGASTIGSSIENSLNNLYEEASNSIDVNSITRGSVRLAKPDILQNQIPSSVGSSRKSVAVSSEEINSPEKSHNNSGNSGMHGSTSSVFDSQENLDRSPHGYQDETPSEYSFANLPTSIPIPDGWEEFWDENIQQLYYVNKVTGAKWFTSTDPQGKIYFYEENSSQSSWLLPEISTVPPSGETQGISEKSPKGSTTEPTEGLQSVSNSASNSDEVLSFGTVKKRHSAGDAIDRGRNQNHYFSRIGMCPGNSLPRFTDSLPRKISIWYIGHQHRTIKEGQLGRTKITESGKKVRKNWGIVHAVLTDNHLSLFKDQKSFTAHKSELEIELNESTVEWTEEKSSRKNVFQLNTRYHLQMLFQSEDKNTAIEWFEDIKRISESYPSDISMRLRSTEGPENLLDFPIDEKKNSSRLYRNKSTKIKITPSDDMQADRKKITANLKKFFSRRPPRESLVKKGIYKDEPVFGCSLEKLCHLEKRTVPLFVEECILAIEQKDENLKTDGIYRASGNLSQVQKIRLQVDQNNFHCLYHEEDVHVLAGSLKLFFREMREPLISYDLFEKSFEAIHSQKKVDKVSKFRDIVKNLAKPNRDTLQALLRHILKVADYAEYNRMMIPNLAIVFGPTLMWPSIESKNMALDLMQQNYVIEALLSEFESIFQ